jgi:hypothetical protein
VIIHPLLSIEAQILLVELIYISWWDSLYLQRPLLLAISS